MNNKITYEIYTDNPPPGSRPLKSQVSELRKEIQNMRLTDEEKEVLEWVAAGMETYKEILDPKGAEVLRKLKERLS